MNIKKMLRTLKKVLKKAEHPQAIYEQNNLIKICEKKIKIYF